jgi:hypothetical protein
MIFTISLQISGNHQLRNLSMCALFHIYAGWYIYGFPIPKPDLDEQDIWNAYTTIVEDLGKRYVGTSLSSLPYIIPANSPDSDGRCIALF